MEFAITFKCATSRSRRPVLRSALAAIQNLRRSLWPAATPGTWGGRWILVLDPDPERSRADGGLILIAFRNEETHLSAAYRYSEGPPYLIAVERILPNMVSLSVPSCEPVNYSRLARTGISNHRRSFAVSVHYVVHCDCPGPIDMSMYSPPCTLRGRSLCKNGVSLRYSIHTIYPQSVLHLLSPATSLFASNRQHQPSGLSRVNCSGERYSWTHILVSTIIHITWVLARRVLPTNETSCHPGSV